MGSFMVWLDQVLGGAGGSAALTRGAPNAVLARRHHCGRCTRCGLEAALRLAFDFERAGNVLAGELIPVASDDDVELLPRFRGNLLEEHRTAAAVDQIELFLHGFDRLVRRSGGGLTTATGRLSSRGRLQVSPLLLVLLAIDLATGIAPQLQEGLDLLSALRHYQRQSQSFS